MSLTRISFLFVSLIAAMCFSVGVVTAQDKFAESQCVTRWTQEVDPAFRLSRATATKRCRTIALRIDTLSKKLLGKWQLIGSKERKETLAFFADGTARRDWYDVGTRKSGSVDERWAIVNPYGTVGSEVIQFNDGYVSLIKISVSTMTIISTPGSHTFEERYKRTK